MGRKGGVMRTSRKEQRAEAKAWRWLAEQMGEDALGKGLCFAFACMSAPYPTHLRVKRAIGNATRESAYFPYLAPTTCGPDWDRCLFACLMAAVAEAGDMDDFREGA